jgi:hypothetical protein
MTKASDIRAIPGHVFLLDRDDFNLSLTNEDDHINGSIWQGTPFQEETQAVVEFSLSYEEATRIASWLNAAVPSAGGIEGIATGVTSS